MKITHIEVSNFQGARSVVADLTKPVAMFCGHNAAGKSSVQEALRLALVGESVRVGLKKEFGQLVTEGQTTGFAEITWDGGKASVVLPGGERHIEGAQIHGALPLVLDAQRFARMTADERRAFLFALMGLSASGAAVKERLTARGCIAEKIEVIMPMLRAGFDAGHKEAQAKAREAKAAWKSATGGETYGSVKAASWKAHKPAVDTAMLTQGRADLEKINAEIEAENRRLGEMEATAKQAKAQAGRIEELREKASLYARIEEKLHRDEKELAEWEEKVLEARAKAHGAVAEQPLACPHCAGLVTSKGGTLHAYEAPTTDRDEEATAKLPEYERARDLMSRAVANGKRDLAASNAAAEGLKELEGSADNAPASDDDIAALKSRIEALKHGKKNQEAGIRMLEDAERAAQQADELTKKAAGHHEDVAEWEAIADALAPSGIPADMLAEALGPINDRLTMSSTTSEWSPVKIDAGMNITADGRLYTLLSESEKWRADAMIAEAVAHLSGVKLLMLDRFDVLDLKGREDLLYWIDGLAEDGEIDTALIFGTLKSLPAQLPASVAGFWIENGAAGQVRAAA